jgi:uncharacterized membrane protein
MKKVLLASAIATTFLTTPAYASSGANDMEKCKVVDPTGKGLIKEHKSDCASANNSCAGGNKAGDADAWIMVPKGDCAKINAGDHSGISKEIKDKLEM